VEVNGVQRAKGAGAAVRKDDARYGRWTGVRC